MRLLEPGPLEELRLLDEAGRQEGARLSAGLRESIEAGALILGVRPDFSTAQARPAPTSHAQAPCPSHVPTPRAQAPCPSPVPKLRAHASCPRLIPRRA